MGVGIYRLLLQRVAAAAGEKKFGDQVVIGSAFHDWLGL